MNSKDFRTATPAELQRDIERTRRARQAEKEKIHTPTAEEIRAAIRNGVRPPRTAGACIQQALEHTKNSAKESPGANQGLNHSSTEMKNESQSNCRPPNE